ncbi:MAG: amino acid permease [Myxococcota bacterium]|nr:amino acid permease [Myxococcales bacterium]
MLGLGDAVLLIVASVVGSGIFFTPARVAALLPDAGLIALAWTVGALLSLAGAFANAELGAMFPRAGGDYVYLREGLHPAAGFLVGWLSFFVIYAGTIAALAVVFAEALAVPLGLSRRGIVALAAAVIAAGSLIHLRSTRLAAVVNNGTSLAKLAALLAFVVVGPIVGTGSYAPWLEATPVDLASGGAGAPPPVDLVWRFGQALSPILFSYLGWNASVYVASEIRDPVRNVPRSLFLGLGLCAVLYLAVNAVYLYALPPAALANAGDAGAAAARGLFGEAGARWVSAFVLVSVLGTLNATLLVGPRIVYAMSLDGHFVSRAGRVHAGFRTPGVAIGVQALVSIGLVVFLETFPRALDFTVFGIVLATCGDVVALFALRRRHPLRTRPFRARGHPWVPGIYLLANLAVGVAIAMARPREAWTTLGLLGLGLLLYAAVFARADARGAGGR